MKTRRTLSALALMLLCLCALPSSSLAGRPGFASSVYATLAAIPTSLTPVAFNGSASASAPTDVYMVVVTNTNASTQATVTVECTTGPVVFVDALLNGVSAQGNHLVVFYPDGLSCPGSVTWSASVSGVNGTITGRQ